MNINQLRYFVAAVDNGSFSAAGSVLFVSSQAVSKAVSEMERETGMKLLVREGTGVHTTEFGRLFYRKATDIVHSFSELESLSDDFALPGNVGGTVNVALAIPFFRGSIPIQTNFDTFCAHHPDAELNVFVNASNACMLALEEDIVDAAVILGRSDDPDLACYKITEIQPQLIVPVDHPLAKRSEVSFRDLIGVPVLSPTDLSFFYKTLLARCREYGFEPKFVTLPPVLDEFRDFLSKGKGVMFVTKDEQLPILYPNTVCIPLAKQDAFMIPVCLLCKRDSKTTLLIALKEYLIDNARLFFEAASSSESK